MTQLAATHEMTIAQAEELMGVIARAKVQVIRAEAKREAQVQRAQEACELETAEAKAVIAAAERRLEQFILGHQDLFRRPRMRACAWGRYGLRSSDRTEVKDPEAAIRWLRANGYGDLVKVTETPISKGVTKLIKDGQEVDGVQVVSGELAKYEIDTTILDSLE